MKHYYCPAECKGVSKELGVCQAEDCSRKGMPGLECDCDGEEHKRALEKGHENSSQDGE